MLLNIGWIQAGLADPHLPHLLHQTFSFLVPHALLTYHIVIMLSNLYVQISVAAAKKPLF
jgi:hypothetical protein